MGANSSLTPLIPIITHDELDTNNFVENFGSTNGLLRSKVSASSVFTNSEWFDGIIHEHPVKLSRYCKTSASFPLLCVKATARRSVEDRK